MLIFHQTASPPNNIKIHTPCQKWPLFLSPLHIFREPHKKYILCTFGNHTPYRPVWLRASNSETIGFSWLGSQTSHSTRVWSPSHATAAQCAEEGGSVGQTRENDGQIILKWTTSQGLYASNPACTHSAHISACTLWYSPWALCFNIAKNCTYTLNTYTRGNGASEEKTTMKWFNSNARRFWEHPLSHGERKEQSAIRPFYLTPKSIQGKKKEGGVMGVRILTKINM